MEENTVAEQQNEVGIVEVADDTVSNDFMEFSLADKLVVKGSEEQKTKIFDSFVEYFGEISNPDNTAINPFFKSANGQASKYAPLNEVLNTIRPVMAKHGLACTQVVASGPEYGCKVATMLIHADGGCIMFPALQAKPGNSSNSIQALGAALTYLRRFALNAVAGVCGEVDDDGSSAGEGKTPKAPPKEKTPHEKVADMARAKAKKNRAKVNEIIQKYAGSEKIKEIPEDKINDVIKELEEIAE